MKLFKVLVIIQVIDMTTATSTTPIWQQEEIIVPNICFLYDMESAQAP